MLNLNEYSTAMMQFESNDFPRGFLAIGSARIGEDDPHYQEVKEIAGVCARYAKERNKDVSFLTGGGPSIMKAWLEEPFRLGMKTGSMALKLPLEPEGNGMAKDEYFFLFDTFQARKSVMFANAKAIIAFKGGFGTMDELFEALTLIQTNKMDRVPIFVYPSKFYKDVLNFDTFVEEGVISPEDADLIEMFDNKDDLIDALLELM